MIDSKLVIRLWETVTEKGIGTLLKPWQIKREGMANLEIERKRMLILAQTERDVEAIKNGDAIVSLENIENPEIISLKNSNPSEDYKDKEPYIDMTSLIKETSNNIIANELRKEINIAKSLLIAEETLSSDNSEPVNEKIEEDWLFRWRDNAGATSSEKLQELWGRILAGEIKSPGKYSLRTLEFIKNISQREAIEIQKLFEFEFNNGIVKHQPQKPYEIDNLAKELNFGFLIKMQSLGLITGVEVMGAQMSLNTMMKDVFSYYIKYDSKVLIIFNKDKSRILQINATMFTPLGLELRSLCKININKTYLKYIIDGIKSQGFQVMIGDPVVESNGAMSTKNIVDV